MSTAIIKLFNKGGGEFVSPPSVFIKRLKNIRAVLFDWDGVFNDGFKRGNDGSIFSEVDAMGTNMLRYALWKRNRVLPVVATITGENNPQAVTLAQRESYHEVFLLSKNKAAVFTAFCGKNKLKPEEVLFFFDDVLDLEVARQAGLRIMIGRPSAPLLKNFAKKNKAVDYITACDGGRHGLREGCELVIGMLGLYDDVVSNRMTFSPDYQTYLTERQEILTRITKISTAFRP